MIRLPTESEAVNTALELTEELLNFLQVKLQSQPASQNTGGDNRDSNSELDEL